MFQRDAYIKRCEARGVEPNPEYLGMYNRAIAQSQERNTDPAWTENNLEYDLRTTDWILDKVRTRDDYAQNLYAALCNNDFQRVEVMPILQDQTWGCSWRYAGGIIADMRETGDYIDWYCSGIGSAEEGFGLGHRSGEGFVSEGHVTSEVEQDLADLGWRVMENKDNNV